MKDLGDTIVREHGQFVDVPEITVGGIAKASPEVGHENLRSLIEFERF